MQAISNPHNTFYAVKRLLGRRFDDPHVKDLASTVSYKIVQGQDKMAWVEDGYGKKHSAVELAGDVIAKMKADAESHLGRSVRRHSYPYRQRWFRGLQLW
jgi:molecular chaperone DnaK